MQNTNNEQLINENFSNENLNHENPNHEKPNHEDPDHENPNHENPNHENLNHENLNHENVNHNENLNQASPVKKARISDRKLEANRRNAQKSTGPLSELGKSYSRINALSHSVYAQKVRLDHCHEDPEEFADICRLMKFELSASGIAENLEAERIAMFHWKLIRLWRYENAMLAISMKDIDKKKLLGRDSAEGNPEIDSHAVPHPVLLETIHRAQKTAERGLTAANKRFKSLREWRQKVKLNDGALFDHDGDVII